MFKAGKKEVAEVRSMIKNVNNFEKRRGSLIVRDGEKTKPIKVCIWEDSDSDGYELVRRLEFVNGIHTTIVTAHFRRNASDLEISAALLLAANIDEL